MNTIMLSIMVGCLISIALSTILIANILWDILQELKRKEIVMKVSGNIELKKK